MRLFVVSETHGVPIVIHGDYNGEQTRQELK